MWEVTRWRRAYTMLKKVQRRRQLTNTTLLVSARVSFYASRLNDRHMCVLSSWPWSSWPLLYTSRIHQEKEVEAHWPNWVLILGQRRRRWPSNKQTLGQCIVLAGFTVADSETQLILLPSREVMVQTYHIYINDCSVGSNDGDYSAISSW